MSANVRAGVRALLDDDRTARPLVSYTFLLLCLLATLTSVAVPAVRDHLGGVAPRLHPWQPITAVFMHGWAGMPAIVHLALTGLLILACGPPVERLLGARRFVLLSVTAIAANAAVVALTPGVNGASLVIWSWGPPLMLALWCAVRADPQVRQEPAWRGLRNLMILMYGAITVVMAALPYLFGWRGSPLIAVARANVFHFTAAGTGAVLAIWWRPYIGTRLRAIGRART